MTGGTLVGLLAGYLAGATPFAWFAGRVLKGVDLRTVGSGNLGATNVYRTLGAPAAAVVLLLDAAKGALAVMVFPRWFAVEASWFPLACGMLAIVGHVKPYFGWFKGGGKGVATTAGTFAALAPLPFGISLAVFVGAVALTRYVSLGSILAAVTLGAVTLGMHGVRSPLSWIALATAAFVTWNHRANIGRLRRGEESRLGAPGGTRGTA